MTVSSTTLIKKIVLVFLVFLGLYFAKSLFNAPAIGAVLATLFLPFCKWMESHRIPRSLAVVLCMLVLITAIIGVGTLLGWQLAALNKDFTLIKQKVVDSAENIQQYVFSNFGVSRVQQIQIIKDQQDAITSIISVFAGSVFYVLSNFVLMLDMYFYCCITALTLKNLCCNLHP